MISSVIPARLAYRCGHAALVSLPRLKGESPSQRKRNQRVIREKTEARGRACDFCGPREEALLAVRPSVIAPPVTLEVPAAAPVVHIAPRVRTRRRRAGARPTPPAAGQPAPAAKATPTVRRRAAPVAARLLQRFEIRFQVETVLQAADVRAALRQVESLGATDVLAIVRNDS